MQRFEIFLAHARLGDLKGRAQDLLPGTELRRAGRFRLPRRRREYLGGRMLLRHLLASTSGDGRTSFQIVTAKNGKPVCVDGPAVSIAHSGETVVCAAMSNGAIGIDVEVPPGPRDAMKIAERFFAAEEAAWIAESPDERFLMLWVIKEAWLKATGSGIAGGLTSPQCAVTPPDIIASVSGDQVANLSLYQSQSAFIGLATTVTSHESVIAYRWDPRANDLVGDSTLRRVAATWNGASE